MLDFPGFWSKALNLGFAPPLRHRIRKNGIQWISSNSNTMLSLLFAGTVIASTISSHQTNWLYCHCEDVWWYYLLEYHFQHTCYTMFYERGDMLGWKSFELRDSGCQGFKREIFKLILCESTFFLDDQSKHCICDAVSWFTRYSLAKRLLLFGDRFCFMHPKLVEVGGCVGAGVAPTFIRRFVLN